MDRLKEKSKKYFNYEGKFIVSHWRQGERTKSSTLFPLCGVNRIVP